MRIHFFTAPFYFAFIWFRVQGSGFKVQGFKVQGFKVQGFKVQGFKVQGFKVQGFKVQGSGFKVQGSGLRWRLRRLFLEDGILVSTRTAFGHRPVSSS